MTLLSRSRLGGLLGFFVLAANLSAGVPTDPAKRAAHVGTPSALAVEPANLVLSGPRAMQQLIVTGKYADGSIRDLTSFATYTIDQPMLALDQTGFVVAAKDGTASVTIAAGGQSIKLPVTVKDLGKPRPVSF